MAMADESPPGGASTPSALDTLAGANASMNGWEPDEIATTAVTQLTISSDASEVERAAHWYWLQDRAAAMLSTIDREVQAEARGLRRLPCLPPSSPAIARHRRGGATGAVQQRLRVTARGLAAAAIAAKRAVLVAKLAHEHGEWVGQGQALRGELLRRRGSRWRCTVAVYGGCVRGEGRLMMVWGRTGMG